MPNLGAHEVTRPTDRSGRKLDVIRVLVAEDHTVVRDGLVAIIKQEADMDVVAETGDGQQAAELWKKHRPDLKVLVRADNSANGAHLTVISSLSWLTSASPPTKEGFVFAQSGFAVDEHSAGDIL